MVERLRLFACGLGLALAACAHGSPSDPGDEDLSIPDSTDGPRPQDLSVPHDLTMSGSGCKSHTWAMGAYTVPPSTRPLFNIVYAQNVASSTVYLAGMLLKTSDSSFYSGLVMRADNSSPDSFVVDTSTTMGTAGFIDTQMWALAGNSAGTLFVGGLTGRAMSRPSGGTFANIANGGQTGSIWSMWAPTSGTGVFMGGAGGKLSYVDGASVTSLDRAATDTVYSIWGTDAVSYSYWAVGPSGKIWKGQGTSAPTVETSPVSSNLIAVWGASPTELYAVGDGGVILTSTGTGTWTQAASGITADLGSVSGADGEVYAVGAGGAIVCSSDHGATWTSLSIGQTTQDLISVGGRPGRVVIVGRGSEILIR